MLELANAFVDPLVVKSVATRYFSTLVYLLNISRGRIVYLQSGRGSDRTLLIIRPEMPKNDLIQWCIVLVEYDTCTEYSFDTHYR